MTSSGGPGRAIARLKLVKRAVVVPPEPASVLPCRQPGSAPAYPRVQGAAASWRDALRAG